MVKKQPPSRGRRCYEVTTKTHSPMAKAQH